MKSAPFSFIRISQQGRFCSQNDDFLASDNALGLAVLATGMSPHELAPQVSQVSQVSTLAIVGEIKRILENHNIAGDMLPVAEASQQLVTAMQYTNLILQLAAEQHGKGNQLVSAVSSLWLQDQHLIMSQIGFHQTFLIREHRITKLHQPNPHDGALTTALIKDSEVPSIDAFVANNHNLDQPLLGNQTMQTINAQVWRLQVGDMVLLCSEGLRLPAETILNTIHHYKYNIEKAMEALIYQAQVVDGNQNISAILVRVHRDFAFKKQYAWLARLTKCFKTTWFKTSSH